MPNLTHSATLTREKETPNKAVFTETPEPGKPPVLDRVYLPKWFVGNAGKVKITVEVLD